jgi:hypothetical protein
MDTQRSQRSIRRRASAYQTGSRAGGYRIDWRFAP